MTTTIYVLIGIGIFFLIPVFIIRRFPEVWEEALGDTTLASVALMIMVASCIIWPVSIVLAIILPTLDKLRLSSFPRKFEALVSKKEK